MGTEKNYYIDCNAFMKWVSDCPHNEQNIDTEIVQMYPNVDGPDIRVVDGNMADINYIQRQVTETKSSKNETTVSARMSLLMTFINVLMELNPYLDYGDKDFTVSMEIEKMPFRYQLAASTLLQLGILKECE